MTADPGEKLPPELRRQLMQRSDAKGLLQLSAHLAMLFLAGLGMQAGGVWALLGFPLYATLLTFLFAPLHESIHFTAFKSRELNNIVAAPIGFLLLLPYRYFRAFHYGHHRHTQDSARDPELRDRPPLTRARYWLQVSGLPYWWENARLVYRHAQGRVDEAFIEPAKHGAIIFEARIHLAGYVILLGMSLLLSGGFLWWYWILPALLGQPLLRLFLLAEHKGCDFSDNMLHNSRTTYTTPWLGFLCWNMCYHAEHHYLASVPFHALPALHAYTGRQVRHRGDGYYRVNRDIFAQL